MSHLRLAACRYHGVAWRPSASRHSSHSHQPSASPHGPSAEPATDPPRDRAHWAKRQRRGSDRIPRRVVDHVRVLGCVPRPRRRVHVHHLSHDRTAPRRAAMDTPHPNHLRTRRMDLPLVPQTRPPHKGLPSRRLRAVRPSRPLAHRAHRRARCGHGQGAAGRARQPGHGLPEVQPGAGWQAAGEGASPTRRPKRRSGR